MIILPCIYEDFESMCDMFYDLDEDEVDYLWCDEDGYCGGNYESCPYYEPYLDEEE